MSAIYAPNHPADHGWIAHWFEDDASPRLIVGRDMAVRAENAAAARLLGGLGPLRIRDGVLACVDARANADLRDFIARAAAGPASVSILDTGPGSRLIVRAVVLRRHGVDAVALQLRDPEAELVTALANMGGAYRLTPAEQRAMEQMLAGASIAELAQMTRRSVNTVRTHVKRAYQKLGIATREQMFTHLMKYAFSD